MKHLFHLMDEQSSVERWLKLARDIPLLRKCDEHSIAHPTNVLGNVKAFADLAIKRILAASSELPKLGDVGAQKETSLQLFTKSPSAWSVAIKLELTKELPDRDAAIEDMIAMCWHMPYVRCQKLTRTSRSRRSETKIRIKDLKTVHWKLKCR